ncbi:hypothetical protein XU18_2750 [Perkinsela sp. CCAP 1560/4]|nr:hypothetical protein XU18_2750 [Perkinsela sp. CCAP 1560/4]|eukprot:KNH06245.1 hypothetical protein XU18_2750 [Perkinsela sp. CCAP 1560/4]
MSETSQSKFSSPRQFAENFFGIRYLKERRQEVEAETINQQKYFAMQQAESNSKLEHVRMARDSLEKQYKEAAIPVLQEIDDASWKKVLIEKAKDLLVEKVSQLDSMKATDGSRPWSFCSMADQINLKSLLLERFVGDWKKVSSAENGRCALGKSYAGLRNAFVTGAKSNPNDAELVDVLFRVSDFQNVIDCNASNRISIRDILTFDKEKLNDLARHLIDSGSETLKQSVSTGKELMNNLWKTLTGKDQLPRSFPLKEKVDAAYANASLSSIFPEQHWSTAQFSQFRKKLVASEDGPFEHFTEERLKIYEQLAFHELTNLLRARIDIERIHMSEFLFQGNNPQVGTTSPTEQ